MSSAEIFIESTFWARIVLINNCSKYWEQWWSNYFSRYQYILLGGLDYFLRQSSNYRCLNRQISKTCNFDIFDFNFRGIKPTITDLQNCRHILNRRLVMVTNGKCMTVMVNHCYNILTQQIETRICKYCRFLLLFESIFKIKILWDFVAEFL